MVHGGSKRSLPPPITPGQFLLFQQTRSGKDVPGLIEYLDVQAHECAVNLRHNPVTVILGLPDRSSIEATASQEGVLDAQAVREAARGANALADSASAASDVAEADADGASPPSVPDDGGGTGVALTDGGSGSAPSGDRDPESAAGPAAGTVAEVVAGTTEEVAVGTAAGVAAGATAEVMAGTEGTPTTSPAIEVNPWEVPAERAQANGGVASALRCRTCMQGIKWGFRFCPSCGGAISYSCPVCSVPVEPVFRYCPDCGALMPGKGSGPKGE